MRVRESTGTDVLGLKLSWRCWNEGDGVTASKADWLTLAAVSCQQCLQLHIKQQPLHLSIVPFCREEKKQSDDCVI